MNQVQIDRKYLIVVEMNPVEQEKHFIYKPEITNEHILISHPRINKKEEGLDIRINYRKNYTTVIYKWDD